MKSILKKLQSEGSILSAYNGVTPNTIDLSNSKIHNSFSINGIPSLSNLPSPSILDLDGVTPPKYQDIIFE